MKVIDAGKMHYSVLNKEIKQCLKDGIKKIILKNVNGQRYIGDALTGNQEIVIEGVPGNDMAAYMNGMRITVNGNTQDAVANTMNDGSIIIHGNAGDALGYAMRGGEVFVKGSVGYRVGIHMKEYNEKKPVLVIGGKAGDFLGEYMAGGVIILLGLDVKDGEKIIGNYCATGMHGGSIYIRGNFDESIIGKEIQILPVGEDEFEFISKYVGKYVEYFGNNFEDIMEKGFKKLVPCNNRPYGKLYAY